MKISVLVAAGGAAWEPDALRALDAAHGRLALLKRCIDLNDLLATAAAGSASVAVVDDSLVGLDADTVISLKRRGVSVVVVQGAAGREGESSRLARLGVDHVVESDALAALPAVLEGAAPRHLPPVSPEPPPARQGQIVAVWGPAGAPGRTTVAVGLAAELAGQGLGTMLVDADPYGGAVAQHLGVLDQVSGLLAAARLGNAGQLDAVRLAESARSVGGLRVLTGLPRADRWVEVRPPAFEQVLSTAATLESCVVVDTGFCLEHDRDGYSTSAGRNAMTVAVVERAEHLVVVGAADPVGLARLARALHEVSEAVPGRVPIVVVNHMRGSLGWSDLEVAATLEAVAPGAPVLFLPDDRLAADRALMSGRSLVEGGDSALRKALRQLAALVSERLGVQALSSR